MGLIVTSLLDSGINVKQSYARIETVIGNKSKLSVYLDYYVNKESADRGVPSFNRTVHEFIPNSDDASERWDKQAYEHIKSLPEFANAVDDLDM